MLLKAEGLYVFGPYRLAAHERQLLRDGQPIPLPPKAFDLLLALVARPGSLVTKEELLAEVWAGTFVEEANLSYTVSLLRKALGEEGYIETVPKSGYRFVAAVSIESAIKETPPRRGPRQRLDLRWVAALLLLVLLGTIGWIVWRDELPKSPLPITTQITSFGGLAFMPRLSPDGKYVVYQWDGRRSESDAVNWDIYLQSVEGADAFQLTTDPQSDFGAAWSPNGERIAFLHTVTPGRFVVQDISRMGGTARTLSPPGVFANGDAIDWSPDGGSIAFTSTPDPSGRRGLALLSLDTGSVTSLTSPPIGSVADRSPRFSPDGRTIAFFRTRLVGGADGDLYTVAVTGGAERRVTSGNFTMMGHDWTADGRELVFSSNQSGNWALWRVRAVNGSDARLVVGVGSDAQRPSIARKTNRLAYHLQRADSDIWRAAVSLGESESKPSVGNYSPVQTSTRMDTSPQVSRDGKRLVFVSQRSGDQGIWVSDIDGKQSQQIAVFPGHPAGSPRWSPSGTRVAFDASIEGHADIYVVGAQGVPQPRRLTTESAENVVASWSGDERWIYFASNRTGRYEVWKISTDGAVTKQVTRNGGFAPFESYDGKFIYYVKGAEEGGIWRVPVTGGEEMHVVDGPTPRFWGYWALLDRGLCFVTQEPYRRAPARVKYFDFDTKNEVTVGDLDTQAVALAPRFAVTPDGTSIVYVKDKPTTSDIMLVKNFR